MLVVAVLGGVRGDERRRPADCLGVDERAEAGEHALLVQPLDPLQQLRPGDVDTVVRERGRGRVEGPGNDGKPTLEGVEDSPVHPPEFVSHSRNSGLGE